MGSIELLIYTAARKKDGLRKFEIGLLEQINIKTRHTNGKMGNSVTNSMLTEDSEVSDNR